MSYFQTDSGGTASFPIRAAAATFFADDVPTVDDIKPEQETKTSPEKTVSTTSKKTDKTDVRTTRRNNPSLSRRHRK